MAKCSAHLLDQIQDLQTQLDGKVNFNYISFYLIWHMFIFIAVRQKE